MAESPGLHPIRDGAMIRVRAARVEAVLIGFIVLSVVVAVVVALQAGLLGAINSIATVITTVTGR